MKKILLFATATVLCCTTVKAQYNIKENNNWVMGYHAGLNFNGNEPAPISTSMVTKESSAAVSDEDGQLLFYTNGDTVWNRNGQVMPNGAGLIAPYTAIYATQASLIVPVIGSAGKYYVFSIEDPANYLWQGDVQSGRLFYSIVNMELDNGNGAVENTAKRIPLDSALTSKMIAVSGDDCKSIWVLVHANDNTVFKAFKITEAGIAAPVISNTGFLSGFLAHAGGQMVVSPDRRKLAAASVTAMPEGLGLEIYDFNAVTGFVSNAVTLDTFRRHQGVAFSPDNSKLYSTSIIDDNLNGLFLLQYDVASPNTAALLNSRTIIDTVSNLSSYVTPLRLAPNGKIYGMGGNTHFSDNVTNTSGADSIFVISAPDLAGTSCNLQINAMAYLNGTGAPYSLGNTYMKTHSIKAEIDADGLNLSTTAPFTTYQWLVNGNAISGATNSTYTVTENGDYQVWVTNETGCVDTSGIHTESGITSISNTSVTAAQIVVFPNPARDVINISAPLAVDAKILSLEGRLLKTIANVTQISVKDLAAGVYFLHLSDSKGHAIKIEKLVKVKN